VDDGAPLCPAAIRRGEIIENRGASEISIFFIAIPLGILALIISEYFEISTRTTFTLSSHFIVKALALNCKPA
jgi:uncharacterized membrane protein